MANGRISSEIETELDQIADHLDAMLLEHTGAMGFRITRDDAMLLRDYLRGISLPDMKAMRQCIRDLAASLDGLAGGALMVKKVHELNDQPYVNVYLERSLLDLKIHAEIIKQCEDENGS